MNSNTGAIAQFETRQDAKLAGFDVPLTPEQYDETFAMPRRQRRAWIAEQKKQTALRQARRFKKRR